LGSRISLNISPNRRNVLNLASLQTPYTRLLFRVF
jgi:hypothetical protein